VVWRARDRTLDRDVAIKFLTGSYSTSTFARERIQAEAQAAAAIRHPAVLTVLDHGEATDESGQIIPYIVTELVPGRTLADRLTEGALAPQVAVHICADLASALTAAHAIGLVHRYVRPGNILLTPSGAKVFDFGIAALIGGPEVDTGEPDTSAFLAPERLTENIVIPATDVYAVGLVLQRTLTGELPWDAETAAQIFAEQVYVAPSPLPSIEGVDPAVNAVCARCLAEDPADRPSAGEVAAILAAAAGTVALEPEVSPVVPIPAKDPQPRIAEIPAVESVTVPMSYPPATEAHPRRHRTVLTLLSVLIFLVAVGVLVVTHRGDSSPQATRAPGVASSGSVSIASTAPASPAPSSAPAPTRTTPSSTPAPSVTKHVPKSTPKPHSTVTKAPPHTTSPPTSSIMFTCTGDRAVIQSAAPNLDWTISEYNPGPSADVAVVFVKLPKTSEIDVHCSRGKATTKVN
jgi:serine/threonine-protein kinase